MRGHDATGGGRTDDVRMPLPWYPDEGISIDRRRHPDERMFGYPLQALVSAHRPLTPCFVHTLLLQIGV